MAASALQCCLLPVSGIHATKERGTRDKGKSRWLALLVAKSWMGARELSHSEWQG